MSGIRKTLEPVAAMVGSEAEGLLLLQIREAGLPEPVCQYRFDPSRRWRADFCWPNARLLVEVSGAIWSRGRHTRGAGYEGDCLKAAAAMLLGWRLLTVTTGMVDDGRALALVRQALAASGVEAKP